MPDFLAPVGPINPPQAQPAAPAGGNQNTILITYQDGNPVISTQVGVGGKGFTQRGRELNVNKNGSSDTILLQVKDGALGSKHGHKALHVEYDKPSDNLTIDFTQFKGNHRLIYEKDTGFVKLVGYDIDDDGIADIVVKEINRDGDEKNPLKIPDRPTWREGVPVPLPDFRPVPEPVPPKFFDDPWRGLDRFFNRF